jgi:hypothetical protein
MAVLDVFHQGPTSTANNAFLTIQPAGTIEVVIHNIIVPTGAAMELEFYDGTNLIKCDEDAVFGSRFGLQLHCTNAKYYRVKNVSGGTVFLAADGVRTRD